MFHFLSSSSSSSKVSKTGLAAMPPVSAPRTSSDALYYSARYNVGDIVIVMGSDDDQELHKVKIKEVLMPQFPGEPIKYRVALTLEEAVVMAQDPMLMSTIKEVYEQRELSEYIH